MKKEKAIRELKIERPRRAVVSEKEAVKRMKDFSKRKKQFQAAVQLQVAGLDSNRLARECSKLDKAQEQQLADEGLSSEASEWREY
jgi:hypothetical protein